MQFFDVRRRECPVLFDEVKDTFERVLLIFEKIDHIAGRLVGGSVGEELRLKPPL